MKHYKMLTSVKDEAVLEMSLRLSSLCCCLKDGCEKEENRNQLVQELVSVRNLISCAAKSSDRQLP